MVKTLLLNLNGFKEEIFLYKKNLKERVKDTENINIIKSINIIIYTLNPPFPKGVNVFNNLNEEIIDIRGDRY